MTWDELLIFMGDVATGSEDEEEVLVGDALDEAENKRLSAHRDTELFALFDGQQSAGHVEFGRVERVQGAWDGEMKKEEREEYVFGMNVSTGAQSVQLEILLVLGVFLMLAAAIIFLYYRTKNKDTSAYQTLE